MSPATSAGPADRPLPPGRAAPVPVAASTTLRPLLEGPPRAGAVLTSFPSAVYVDMGPYADPRVVALVSARAVRLPVAAVLPRPTQAPPMLAAGAPARVGAGELRVGGVRARVARWWDPEPKIDATDPGILRERTGELRRLLESAPATPGIADHPSHLLFATACADGDPAGMVAAAERLVGLGPGLTPSGDDVLAGSLLALRLLGGALPEHDHDGIHPALAVADSLGAAAVNRDTSTRTTAIATTLLACAARGEAAAEVGAALEALAGRDLLGPAVRRLLAVGHTSGVDLAHGLLAGCLAGLALTGHGMRYDGAMLRASSGQRDPW